MRKEDSESRVVVTNAAPLCMATFDLIEKEAYKIDSAVKSLCESYTAKQQKVQITDSLLYVVTTLST
jgi:hypothetical protein